MTDSSKQLDPSNLDAVKYVAAVFDTCLYGGRTGGSGRFYVRSRDKSVMTELQAKAGGTLSMQADKTYLWYGSIKDWEFYIEVIKYMHSPERKEKLAAAIGPRIARKSAIVQSPTDQASLKAAADHLDKMVQQVQDMKAERATSWPSTPLDLEAPNGRYKDGTPRLPFEGKKLVKDLTLDERTQYQERLRSRPKIRLAVESLQLIMLLGEKDKHPPELIAKARERRQLIQQCILAEGIDACVEKHAPTEWPDWYNFDKAS